MPLIFEQDGVLADEDSVVILQRLLANALVVDVGAIEALSVFHHITVGVPVDLGVMARDSEIIYLKAVVGQAADGDDRILPSGHFFQSLLFEFQIAFCHVRVPFLRAKNR